MEVKEAFIGKSKPSIAVDAVILRVHQAEEVGVRGIARKALQVILVKREEENKWHLPGSFMGLSETPNDVLHRIVKNRAPIGDVYFEQLYTVADDLFRDPRGRVVSIVYIGIAPENSEINIIEEEGADARWFWIDHTKEELYFTEFDKEEHKLYELLFDHKKILDDALIRIQGKLMYTNIGFNFIGETFTLKELENVFNAIYMKMIPGFRRLIINKVEETGEIVKGKAFRPALLYKLKREDSEKNEDSGNECNDS